VSAVSSTGRTAGDWVRWVVRGLGQALITIGVVVLLFTFYELQVTGIYTSHQQKALGKSLDQQWQAAAPAGSSAGSVKLPPYVNGRGVARIYFPTLGKDQVHVVVEGVSHEDLKKGPGHYPGTARPGAIGNTVISGHRTTYGAPFNRLDELHAGDPIVVETETSWFTYRVTGLTVVQPNAIDVTYPVPGKLGATPTQRLLTLTTCNPKYSASTRLVVHAVLQQPLAKGPGVVPPALERTA
jgi:sortase A